MTTSFSFDSNVLIYAADRYAGPRHDQAKSLLRRSAETGRASVTEQSLMEFIHVITRRAALPVAGAATLIVNWLGFFRLLLPHQGIIADSLELSTRFKLNIWDAQMLAVCAANGHDVLLSEDMQDRCLYKDVRVINPFATRNSALIEELIAA
jgi:predicted nucleic acid-binding protein